MLLLPDTELHLTARIWSRLSDTLCEKTEGRHESGAFMLGHVDRRRRYVEEIVYYDDLDARAYESGVVVLHAGAFGPLWKICRERKLEVVADVHLHSGAAFQSRADIENPMIAQRRHVAMILPNFARAPIAPEDLGLFEYRGRHQWRALGHRRIRRHLKIGI